MLTLTAWKARLGSREDSEHEQAFLRIVIVGLVLAYMAVFHGWPNQWSGAHIRILLVLCGFEAIAIAIFVAICAQPKPNVLRRIAGMIADVAGCTWYMWVAGEYGFFVIGIYLFITFGNGFRYGRQYLFGCQALSVLGLSSVLLFVPFWQERRIAGIGLLIALVVLPLYVSTLLKRIQEARARAEEANVAKTTFLANMSHEIRTPLNGIVGVVDLFKTTDLSSQQRELVQLLRHSVAVLRSLVDDVLDISKIESGRLTIEVTSFDLYATINGLIALLRPHAQSKGLSLHASVDPEIDYRLRGDANHLRQILLNLLGNAIKFTERGEVTLTVALRKSTAEGITTRFEVRDTGIGITEDQLPKIFERFVQADQSTTRKFGGSGLGTTIAKELVELMGGNIGVSSRVGDGTTFWFELPLLHESPVHVDFGTPRTSPLSSNRTILIADQASGQSISTVLRAVGEQVEMFAPSDAIGARLEAAVSSGLEIRALVAFCAVDTACAAFTSALQRLRDRPLALIYIARGPLSVVDSARIKSIREAQVLVSPVVPRIMANAIHAALANSSRDTADVIDLSQLIKRDRAKLRILVADDNPTNQAILSQLLSSAGHSVLVASDGEEALDVFEHENPDFALLDFNMPHRNGVEVVRAIRMMDPVAHRTPTIILSASVTQEARERALSAGADDFVGKPFDAASLLSKVDSLAKHLRPDKRIVASRPAQTAQVIGLPNKTLESNSDRNNRFIDYERLEELEDIARDSAFMTKLLRGFKGDVETLLQRIEAVVAVGDGASIPDLLHALKGAAVGVGAPELASMCDNSTTAEWCVGATAKLQLESFRSCIRETIAQLDGYARKQHRISL